MIQTVSKEEVVEMLAGAARSAGLDLPRFYELGMNDRLDNPHLRDLWLIWGDVLDESDVATAE